MLTRHEEGFRGFTPISQVSSMFIRRLVVDIIRKRMSISSIKMFKILAANRLDGFATI
jgi:hypothetical protein